MSAWLQRVGLAVGLGLSALGCGEPDSPAQVDEASLLVDERTAERIAGRFVAAGHAIELSSRSATPFAGDVTIEAGALDYSVRYDYAAREVVSDGHGKAIDRELQRVLGATLELVTLYLGPNNPQLPLHEQMLYASLALLQESGGMPLGRMAFELEPTEQEKSLGNDGVRCIQRRQAYPASYDYGDTLVEDTLITADVSECNGRCGPTCTQLTPWNMWTLDCLEHDACCDATSTDSCWTPLGECGDEYAHAQTDFLRGFDPFRKHCGG